LQVKVDDKSSIVMHDMTLRKHAILLFSSSLSAFEKIIDTLAIGKLSLASKSENLATIKKIQPGGKISNACPSYIQHAFIPRGWDASTDA